MSFIYILFVDNQYLASGGNDNRLYVWNQHALTPVQSYTEHMAAVKAIAWSPHHHGLLVSGGIFALFYFILLF